MQNQKKKRSIEHHRQASERETVITTTINNIRKSFEGCLMAAVVFAITNYEYNKTELKQIAKQQTK